MEDLFIKSSAILCSKIKRVTINCKKCPHWAAWVKKSCSQVKSVKKMLGKGMGAAEKWVVGEAKMN